MYITKLGERLFRVGLLRGGGGGGRALLSTYIELSSHIRPSHCNRQQITGRELGFRYTSTSEAGIFSALRARHRPLEKLDNSPFLLSRN
jgi:hypothetical protein